MTSKYTKSKTITVCFQMLKARTTINNIPENTQEGHNHQDSNPWNHHQARLHSYPNRCHQDQDPDLQYSQTPALPRSLGQDYPYCGARRCPRDRIIISTRHSNHYWRPPPRCKEASSSRKPRRVPRCPRSSPGRCRSDPQTWPRQRHRDFHRAGHQQVGHLDLDGDCTCQHGLGDSRS